MKVYVVVDQEGNRQCFESRKQSIDAFMDNTVWEVPNTEQVISNSRIRLNSWWEFKLAIQRCEHLLRTDKKTGDFIKRLEVIRM